MTKRRLSKREIKKRIYLTGQRPFGYQIMTMDPVPGIGTVIVRHVDTVKVGHAIVRALRELEYQENGR